MQADGVTMYVLTGIISVFGILAFFFFKAYLSRIDNTFKRVEETLAELEDSIKKISEFIARQDEKNRNQSNINLTAESKYTNLSDWVGRLEKQVTKLENRLLIVERLNNVK